MNGQPPFAFVISSPSVHTWWRSTAGTLAGAPSILIDERDGMCVSGLVERVAAALPAGAQLVFLSSHSALDRDRKLSAALGDAGFADPFGVTAESCALGLDKVEMKHSFETSGVATPAWWTGSTADAGDKLLVRKPRGGTMGLGNCLVRRSATGGDDETYLEEFVFGVEYSIILVRWAGRTRIYPPVWKGRTNVDLIPPYRRARLCTPVHSHGDVQMQMVRISAELAHGIDFEGFLEVEFVVTEDGRPLALEINPRIAGTMRMSALAANRPLFEFPLEDGLTQFDTTMLTAELPLDELLPPTFEGDGISATSRVTIVAPDAGLLFERLDRVLACNAKIPKDQIKVVVEELRHCGNVELASHDLNGHGLLAPQWAPASDNRPALQSARPSAG